MGMITSTFVTIASKANVIAVADEELANARNAIRSEEVAFQMESDNILRGSRVNSREFIRWSQSARNDWPSRTARGFARMIADLLKPR